MIDISNLLFRREHFPVRLIESKEKSGKSFFDFETIYIPPYHPSMKEEGIDVNIAASVLDEALEDTVRDLQEIASKRTDAKLGLESITRDEAGKIVHSELIKEGDTV